MNRRELLSAAIAAPAVVALPALAPAAPAVELPAAALPAGVAIVHNIEIRGAMPTDEAQRAIVRVIERNKAEVLGILRHGGR